MTIQYPYLPEGRTIKYVPAHDRFMRAAEDACRELSTDHNHPTSAVLVKNGMVIGRAANQSALKNEKLIKLHREGFCIRRLLKIPSGQKYWLCPGCASSRNHAETLVMKLTKKQGIDTRGADIYHWGHWWCCKPCWDSMIAGGVRDVYLLDESEKLFNPKSPDNILGK
ncbi:MAG: deaminase [Patescibacteria group bacterium]